MPRDNFSSLDTNCPSCGETELKLIGTTAAHDDNLIDLIAECDNCGLRLNSFVDIREMEVLEKGDPPP